MYLAHIAKDGRTQSLKVHLENTANKAARFAEPFNLSEEAYLTGLLHDIGKYSDEFQKRLHGGPKVDHSTAGALEAFKNKMIVETFCVAGHHSGLPNRGGATDLEGSSLYARINRAQKNSLPSYSAWKNELTLTASSIQLPLDFLEVSYRIRMIFSCLVDADYLDTESFMEGNLERGKEFEVEDLQVKTREYIAQLFLSNSELNKLRCNILKCVMSEGEKLAKGLYTFTVPTGGGKTIASLAFAIEHAKKNDLKRIIYVIPHTSIIEQTADVFRKILGEGNVLEHHSDFEYGDDEESLFYLKTTENWDIPIVVTTNVQFFESFFKNKPSSSRKLHNIANSIVIFDEAQMLPIPFMKPCISLLTELVKNYSTSVVLCTATQPSLNKMIQEFYPEYSPYELCPEEYYDNELFKRVKYTYEGLLSFELLMKQLDENEQYLCIVNSRNAAQQIYSYMDGDDSFHLSANMYPAHRKMVLSQIIHRLKNGLPCKVVSTSLVEAGVDLDFPCVYRQIAGIDSILQAGGRCNREGKRNKDKSVVHIFDLELGSPEMFSMQIAAAENVIENYENIDSKEAIKAYFDQLFYLKGRYALDQYQILSQLSTPVLAFQDVSDKFNLIDNNTRTLYIECKENRSVLDKIRLGLAQKSDYRKIALYSVNIYEYQYQQLKDYFAVEELTNGNCILIDGSLYSPYVGLKLEFKVDEAIII